MAKNKKPVPSPSPPPPDSGERAAVPKAAGEAVPAAATPQAAPPRPVAPVQAPLVSRSAPAPTGNGTAHRDKPVHEVRIGRVKAVIWANQTEAGIRHNVTLRRLFKRDGSPQWEQSDSFGRDDLPLVMEVSRQAWLWIYAHSQG